MFMCKQLKGLRFSYDIKNKQNAYFFPTAFKLHTQLYLNLHCPMNNKLSLYGRSNITLYSIIQIKHKVYEILSNKHVVINNELHDMLQHL